MTEQEMRELDAWLAEHVFGIKVEYDVDGEPYNREARLSNGLIIGYIWHYAKDPKSFTAIKREIERRGWIWQAAYCLEGGYDFAIFDPDGSVVHSLDGEETEVARILAVEHAETEELAGCLAFKATVEGTK